MSSQARQARLFLKVTKIKISPQMFSTSAAKRSYLLATTFEQQRKVYCPPECTLPKNSLENGFNTFTSLCDDDSKLLLTENTKSVCYELPTNHSLATTFDYFERKVPCLLPENSLENGFNTFTSLCDDDSKLLLTENGTRNAYHLLSTKHLSITPLFAETNVLPTSGAQNNL